MPRAPVGLLAVVARAGPQVSGVGVSAVADLVLVQAPVYVGVVVGDLKGRDHTVGVLLNLVGRRTGTALLDCQRILIRILAGVRVDHCAGRNTAVTRVLVPRVVRVGPRVNEELKELTMSNPGGCRQHQWR